MFHAFFFYVFTKPLNFGSIPLPQISDCVTATDNIISYTGGWSHTDIACEKLIGLNVTIFDLALWQVAFLIFRFPASMNVNTDGTCINTEYS